jgi:hypothetical protein
MFRVYTCRFGAPFVAAGGYFTDSIEFAPGVSETSAGGEDAFIVLLTEGGAFEKHVRIGAGGHERITAVAVDPFDQGILVTGYYSGTDVNFDPLADPGQEVYPPAYEGGTDVFVARYYLKPGGTEQFFDIRLDWLFVMGTSGDDSGAGVGVDVLGHAYATGWVRDGGGERDLWIARIPEPPDNLPNATTAAEWSYVYEGSGDEAGLSLAVDGLDRVLVSGQFGQSGAGSRCLDFDPGAGVDQHCTAGGLDLFVTRLRPDGAYDWTFAIGGATFDEVGAAIDVDPVLTTRIAHAGWFGYPGAPSGYQVDFDPGPGEWLLTCTGSGDGFVSSLVPTIAEGVGFEVSLLVDNSASIDTDPEYAIMMEALDALLADPLVVPQNGSVAMNGVWFSVDLGGQATAQLMPWTVLDGTTAPLFARRLANHPRPAPNGVLGTNMADGVSHSVASIQSSPVLNETYSTVLMIADGGNTEGEQEIEDARDDALGIVGGNPPDPMLAKVDQIAAFAVRQPPGPGEVQIDRNYALSHVIGSVTVFDWPDPEGNLGIAAETPNDPAGGPPYGFTDPLFATILERTLMRSTVCPADYDRNGTVDQNDFLFFQTDSFNMVEYADWNFDGTFDGHIQMPEPGRDRKKFLAGQAVPGACHVQ